MEAGIPVLGASITILFMLACFASPGVGLAVEWLARHRKQEAKV
ncbi:MAG TPA: hypothetical protein PLR94_05685 [Accumulibacter sp.]|nr:hypothetical protein [Accumulibacter sp.]HMW63121.1 hypothetical protein [Accumulibacter sp.]HMW80200.1 hypothetical protein [Accumulibacter sp.]HMX68749.1 hypothetical protein [Accumulibacter sp.]HNB67080.1 hypothetical protein [Accumulibacter sp.]HNC26186.1 hypothetical protein [Accumulibacter sp.]